MTTHMPPHCKRPTWLGLLLTFGLMALPAAYAQGLRTSPTLGSAALKAAQKKASTPQQADYIVAIVGQAPVTAYELRQRIERLEQTKKSPLSADSDAIKQQALDQLINEKAQLQWANELGIKVSPAQVAEAANGIAQQNQLTLEQLKQSLRDQNGVEWIDFQNNLRDQMTLQRLREREIDTRVRVSEADIDRFVADKLNQVGAEQQIQLAQILIAVPEDASPAQQDQLKAKAQALAAQAQQPNALFADLARQNSQAPDAAQGGDLGLKPAQRYPALFIESIKTLRDGQVLIEPVRSPAGFHVLKLISRRVAGLPNDKMTQTRVSHILLRLDDRLSETQAIAKLLDVRKRIEASKTTFEQEAKLISQDGSAANGGDLGWASPGMFVPEFEDGMNQMPINKVSPPLVSRFGVHLLLVRERKEIEVSEQERREQIRQAVREQKIEEQLASWTQDIREKTYVEIKEAPLP